MIFLSSLGMVYAEDCSINETIIMDNNEIALANESLSDVTVFDFNYIQSKIDSSNNDTLQIENGNYVSNSKAIIINKSITLEGSFSTLDGKGLSDIFDVQEGNSVTLKNMNIINSKGSAIFTNNANLHIINCTFSQNNGVLNSMDSNIFIDGCEFKNNNLIEGYYYIVTVSLGTLRITNSNFTDNAAGLRFDNDYAIKCTVDSCNFINNGCGDGGALQVIGGIITNSLFINNQCSYGGAILSYVDLIVENCSFINNTAIEGGSIIHYGLMNPKGYEGILRIVNSIFINSTASVGNSICAYFSDVELINSTVSSMDNINNIYIKIGYFKNVDSTVSPNNIKILSVIPAKFIAKKLIVTYNSAKYYSAILLQTEDQTACPNSNALIKIYKGKKLITSFTKKVDDFSYFKFKVNPKWGIGKFKVVIHQTGWQYDVKDFVSYIVVNKAKTTVKVPKSIKKYKKLHITIKNKKTKKAISKVKIKVKVYTGKKYKTFKIKTDKKGIAKLNISKLKKGKHALIIKSLNNNYKISKKTYIKVR